MPNDNFSNSPSNFELASNAARPFFDGSRKRNALSSPASHLGIKNFKLGNEEAEMGSRPVVKERH